MLGDAVAATDARTSAVAAVRGSAASFNTTLATCSCVAASDTCSWATSAAVPVSLDSTLASSAAASASDTPYPAVAMIASSARPYAASRSASSRR